MPRAADSPSWLAQHPSLDVVYAALEGEQTVAAFAPHRRVDPRPLGAPVEAGAAVCHVAVAPDGGSLIASCWGDGRVVRMALDAAGRPSAPSLGAAAVDPFAGPVDPFAAVALDPSAERDTEVEVELAAASRSLRAARATSSPQIVPGYDEVEDIAQELGGGVLLGAGQVVEDGPPQRVSRAHAAAFLDDGRIATTDLGFDLVRIWRPAADGLRPDHEVVLPPGTGPRHMVLHPSGHLHVVTEFSCEMFTLGAGRDGRWRLLGDVRATALPAAADTAAELARSRDGEFLYAGLRGSNTIATLRVRGSGERVEPVALG